MKEIISMRHDKVKKEQGEEKLGRQSTLTLYQKKVEKAGRQSNCTLCQNKVKGGRNVMNQHIDSYRREETRVS